jgi:hypothetical protein
MIARFLRTAPLIPALWVGLAVTPEVGAQDPRSVLTLLPTEGREIAVGDARDGALTDGDPFSTVGILLQAWQYRAQGGETVTFDLISDAFDAYLYLVGPSLPFPLGDDDGGGRCDARITYTFPAAGEYRVVVSEAVISDGGTFILRALADPPVPSTETCVDVDFGGDRPEGEEGPILPDGLSAEGRILPVPGQVEGVLDAFVPGPRGLRGGVLEAWAVTLEVNQTVTFDLVSDELDALLYVTGPGLSEPLWDDDGGEGLNSRLTFTAPASGIFLVVASSFEEATGGYILRVTGD